MATTAVPQRRLLLSEANGRLAGSLAFVPIAREPLLVESVQRTPSHFPFLFSLFQAPLPNRLKQNHPRRHRHIQRTHRPTRRNRHQKIAPLARQLMQPFAFSAQHNPNRTLKIHLGVILLRTLIEPHQPIPRLLHLLHRPHKILHPRHRKMRQRPRARSTVSVSPAARLSGITTPFAPAASDVRTIAPKLCGSSIPSKITSRPCAFFARSKSSSSTAGFAAASAAIPWCSRVPVNRSIWTRSSNRTGTFRDFASRTIPSSLSP